MQYKRHFFVCQTKRPPFAKPSCAARRSEEILERLVEAIGTRPELWNEVAVTAAGCLGPCFDGPSIVVYPENCWYVGVKLEDVQEIVESHLIGGRPVERLRFNPPERPA